MSTFKEIIERVDEFKPNDFSTRTKLNWLTTLDGKLATDVFLLSIEEIRALPHKYPEALECEGLISYPHEDVYELWLQAKIDYAHEDYDKFHNTMEQYNEAYSTFKNFFLSTYRPAQGRQVCGYELDPGFPVYYITAYGLSVMKGFRGTIDEWFEAMKIKGDPGKSAYEYALEGGFIGTEEAFIQHMAANGKTAYEYAVDGGYTGSVEEFQIKLAAEYAPVNHDHAETYAAKNHDHAQLYAAKNHSHGETYAASGHNHDDSYAEKGHNHDSSYAAKTHKHSAADVGALPSSGGKLTGAVTMKGMHLTSGVDYGDSFPTSGLTEGRLFLIAADSAAAAELG